MLLLASYELIWKRIKYICVYIYAAQPCMWKNTVCKDMTLYVHACFRVNNFAAKIISFFGKWAGCTCSSLPNLLRSRQTQVWCSNLRLHTKFYFILLLFRAADVISQFKLKMRRRKFRKKKKTIFFFSFSSMKSISNHFGEKRIFFFSEIIYTKTGMRAI